VLERSLSGSGFAVRAGASDWALSEPDGALVAMLADGIAAACTETALLTPAAVEAWRLARETGARVKIGHVDLFARPGA
jgi:hypothetical protein